MPLDLDDTRGKILKSPKLLNFIMMAVWVLNKSKMIILELFHSKPQKIWPAGGTEEIFLGLIGFILRGLCMSLNLFVCLNTFLLLEHSEIVDL